MTIEAIKRVLNNHPQSSLEGLHQLIGGSIEEIRNGIDQLIEEDWLTDGLCEWNGTIWTVYKKKKQKQTKP